MFAVVVIRGGEDLKMEVKIKRVLSSLLSVSKRGLRPCGVFLLRGCNGVQENRGLLCKGGLLRGGLGSCTALCQVALAICHLAAGLDQKFLLVFAPFFLYFCARI